jgi:hypothetical protein
VPDFLAAASGAVLLGGAGIWASRTYRQDRRLVNDELGSDDPTVRRGILENFGERSLASHAKALATLARTERDPEVLAALTELVSRRQWEPLDSPMLVELRARVSQLLAEAPTSGREQELEQEFDLSELVASVEEALGEAVRELRLNTDWGSFELRPDPARPSSPSTAYR